MTRRCEGGRSAAGHGSDDDQLVPLLQLSRSVASQRAEMGPGNRHEATLRQFSPRWKKLGQAPQSLVDRAPVGQRELVRNRLGRLVTSTGDDNLDLHSGLSSSAGPPGSLCGLPQQGQSGLRLSSTIEGRGWGPAIIHRRPNIGLPAPESILIASRAAREPSADEIAPKTGNFSSNGGSSG